MNEGRRQKRFFFWLLASLVRPYHTIIPSQRCLNESFHSKISEQSLRVCVFEREVGTQVSENERGWDEYLWVTGADPGDKGRCQNVDLANIWSKALAAMRWTDCRHLSWRRCSPESSCTTTPDLQAQAVHAGSSCENSCATSKTSQPHFSNTLWC